MMSPRSRQEAFVRSLPESPAEPVQADSDDEGEGVVDLHFTRSALDSGGVGEFDMDAGDVLRRAGCGEDQPFILGADGWYDVELNRFLRELNGWGVRSANSIKAYARDVMLFCRFLHEARGGKSIWECGTADLRAYKRVRLHTEGPLQVSVATWRRSVAVLD